MNLSNPMILVGFSPRRAITVIFFLNFYGKPRLLYRGVERFTKLDKRYVSDQAL